MKGGSMRQLLLGAVIAALVPLGAYAQSAADLAKGQNDTQNILNYGMGYDLQRYSKLTKINKDNVKKLVPVWNYSYDDNRAEESQPLVYNGVIYVTTHAATIAIDAKTGRQIWKTKVEYPPEVPRIVCCGIINGVLPCLTARYTGQRSTPMSWRSMPKPASKFGSKT